MLRSRRPLSLREMMCLTLLALPTVGGSAAAQWVGVSITDTSSGPTVRNVTISYCKPMDTVSFNASSLQILLRGTNITSSFSYATNYNPSCQQSAVSTGTINLVPGSNLLQASISDMAGNSGGSSKDFPVPLPPAQHAAPVVDASPNPGDVFDPAKCVLDCFENVFTYSMPGYISKDVDRGFTLVYRSGRAHPVATVAMTVQDTCTVAPTKHSLKVRRGDGSFVTFLNGRTALFFAGTSLAGQFDVSGMSTRRLNYTSVVTSYWSDGTAPLIATAATPVLVVNEANSPYGAGIGIAGVQRLVFNPEAEAGIIVTNGSGGASWFGASTMNAPVGDFSSMSISTNGYTRRYPDGTRVIFSADGYHLQTIDPFGNTTSYSYIWSASSNASAVSLITDPAGVTTTIGYSDGTDWWLTGKLHSIRQNVGATRLAYFGVDVNNHLTTWVDVDGAYRVASYDGAHRMTHLTDRGWNPWDFGYSPIDGSLSKIQGPMADLGRGWGRPTRNITAPTVPAGAALANAPDTPVAAGIAGWGSVIDSGGVATSYQVNRFGSPTRTIASLGQQSLAQYDANGLPVSTSSTGAPPTFLEWSGVRLNHVTQGSSDIHYGDYDTLYNRPGHVWGTLPEQWFTYDLAVPGHPLLTARSGSTPADSAARFTHAPDGRVLSQADAMGHGQRWAYAPSGFQNLASTTDVTVSGSKVTSFSPDVFGRLASVTDAAGHVTTSAYDALNLVTSTVGARDDTTRVYRDVLGNDTLVVDARGNRYITRRDALGWVRTQLDPLNNAESFYYDALGNVTASMNGRWQTITATYDALNRVASTTLQAENQTTTYSYDSAGLWVAVSNGASTDTVRLNANMQVAQQQTARPGYSRSVRATYDLNSQRTGVNVLRNGIAADSIRYMYGSAGELTSIVDPLGNFTNLTYDSDHLLKGTTYAGGAYAANTWSSSHVLVGRTYPNTPSLDSAFGRTYVVDSLSRVRESRKQDVVRRYGYDASGELTSQGDWQRVVGGCTSDPDYGYRCAYTGEVPVAGSIRAYGYDLVGNPTDTGTAVFTGNRLTRFAGDTILYDPDGNVIQRYRIASQNMFNQMLTWNSASQLTAVSTTRNGATTSLQFAYDGNGRRVKKTVVGGSETQYVWDGDQIVAETDAFGNTQRLYTYFPGTDQLNSVVAGGQTYYAAQDAAGNVIGMIDRNYMTAKDKYSYQPFGTMDQNDQNVPNSLRWKGLLYDAESGLYYVRARYYAPEMRRFLSEDPIGLAGGINQYVFAGNDPVNNRDPSGRECVTLSDRGRLCYLPPSVTTAPWNYSNGCESNSANPCVVTDPNSWEHDWQWASFRGPRQGPVPGGGSGPGSEPGAEHGTKLQCGIASAIFVASALETAALYPEVIAAEGAVAALGAFGTATVEASRFAMSATGVLMPTMKSVFVAGRGSLFSKSLGESYTGRSFVEDITPSVNVIVSGINLYKACFK